MPRSQNDMSKLLFFHLICFSSPPPAPFHRIVLVAKHSRDYPRNTRREHRVHKYIGRPCCVPAVRQHGGGDASGRHVPGGHVAHGWPDVQKNQEQMGLEQEGAGNNRGGEERPVAE